MAAHDQSRLPPSPPPSPPRRRHRKHQDDPFLDLDTQLPSSSSPSSSSKEGQEPQDSLFTRVRTRAATHRHNLQALRTLYLAKNFLLIASTQIIITPVLITSFILSLFLINRSDRLRRTNSHSTSSLFSYLSPSAWLDPEPYQDPDNTTWDRRGSISHVEPHGVLNPQNELQSSSSRDGKERRQSSWHLHKKIRKVAKLEISDAFEMRGRVIVVMLSAVVMVVGMLIVSVRWMVGRIWWGER